MPENNKTRPEPRCSTGVEGGTQLYQPHPKHIEHKSCQRGFYLFKKNGFYTWLHYNPQVKEVLCFYCNKVFTDNRSSFGKKVDAAFVAEGFPQLEEGFREICSSPKNLLFVTQ